MEAKHGCDDEWATSSKDDEATSKDGDKRGDPSDAEICARVAAFLFEALEDDGQLCEKLNHLMGHIRSCPGGAAAPA
jgi:hypothetical protein